MKKLNYYYLVAGLLSILFSITHELNGQFSVLPILYLQISDLDTINSLQSVWHIITAENLVFGIVFITMSFSIKIKNSKPIAWFILLILVTRLFVIITTTLITAGAKFSSLWTDTIAIVLYSVVIFLGITRDR